MADSGEWVDSCAHEKCPQANIIGPNKEAAWHFCKCLYHDSSFYFLLSQDVVLHLQFSFQTNPLENQ